MHSALAYDGVVKRLYRALAAVFGLMGLAVVLTLNAGAQIHGAPPSVTSLGFGGHPFSGITPSVTSLGPRGFTPSFNPAFPNSRPFIMQNPPLNNHHHHHNGGNAWWDGVYAVPYYYGYYDSGDEAEGNTPEEQYNGGPTIFDRRGPGYVPRPPMEPPDREPAESVEAAPAPEPAPAAEQPQTVLIFKDGHQLEVANYAIVGTMLYDLTEGHRRKIALSDLDLTATAKENDDRGIDFQLPAALNN